MSDFSDALTFSLAAPFIVVIIGLIKSYITLRPKILPLLSLGLSVAWGAVLWQAGYYDGDLPTFIIVAIVVSTSANGMQAVYRTFDDTGLRLNQPPG